MVTELTFNVDSRDNNFCTSGNIISSNAACKRFNINLGASTCNVFNALENRNLKIKKLSSTKEIDGLCLDVARDVVMVGVIVVAVAVVVVSVIDVDPLPLVSPGIEDA